MVWQRARGRTVGEGVRDRKRATTAASRAMAASRVRLGRGSIFPMARRTARTWFVTSTTSREDSPRTRHVFCSDLWLCPSTAASRAKHAYPSSTFSVSRAVRGWGLGLGSDWGGGGAGEGWDSHWLACFHCCGCCGCCGCCFHCCDGCVAFGLGCSHC